jgi:molybdate transport system ATP-binding protein
MSLDATIAVEVGSLQLDLSLQVAGGSITAILGPNGAGKTTLLRSLSGLIGIDRGRVVLNGVTLDDTDERVHSPSERRRIGMVFQDQQLFPDMSVLENVAFGLRARSVSRIEARSTAESWLDRVGLGGFGDRRPRELSGGQAQRVALARAMAVSPALVLLDEPLSALDAENRARLRPELRDHLCALEVPTVLVTHDLVDAQMIADQVVVLEHGRITQTGTIDEIAADPRSPYIVELVSRI